VCIIEQPSKPQRINIWEGMQGPMQEKPMLNSPVEVQSIAAEEFAKKAISRLDAAHNARQALNSMLFEAGKPDLDHIERDKRRFTALAAIFNRKTFGAAG
jgi:hypothetical protein